MTLQTMIIEYLESKGWYFDWDHINEVWGDDDPNDPYFERILEERKHTGSIPLNERPDAIRTLHGWTLPQWGEYWMEPYSDDPTHKNFGKPKKRRYENLKDALWSQLLREEEPETYGVFYNDNVGSST